MVTVSSTNNIEYIRYPDNTIIYSDNKKSISFDYVVVEDTTYTFYIKTKNNSEVQKTIKIEKIYAINNLENIDQYIYLDASFGNDETGDGTINNPYKTLSRVTSRGVIQNNIRYAIVLGEGSYTLSDIFSLNYNKSITVVGQREKTVIYADRMGSTSTPTGTTNYTVSFIRLVWDGRGRNDVNTIHIRNGIHFNAVVFRNIGTSTYGYFTFSSDSSWTNCLLTNNAPNFFRRNGLNLSVTNCYGGFTSGYTTEDSDWYNSSNYITGSPGYNSVYRITDSTSQWLGQGYGTNLNGSVANRGVYGGKYSWDFNDTLFQRY